MSETPAHDHELEVLEDDQTVPPRPEEEVADAPVRAPAHTDDATDGATDGATDRG